ncbi:MAG: hypothetical protein M0015_18440 [Betaproteobacteria bacterium]|nr:hypothetical protein [Betaproteobacteria bacterium]
MRITLDLPVALLQRIKLRAVHRKRKLKDEIAALIEAGLAHAPAPEAPRKPPKPVRLRGRGPLTLREIESAIHADHE